MNGVEPLRPPEQDKRLGRGLPGQLWPMGGLGAGGALMAAEPEAWRPAAGVGLEEVFFEEIADFAIQGVGVIGNPQFLKALADVLRIQVFDDLRIVNKMSLTR